MRNVPRAAFLPDELAEFAYEDSALSIEAGQTISQPYIVALMIDAAGIEPGDTVLEIGAGSGYAAARSEEHTSELQSLMRISYAVFCLKKKKTTDKIMHL